MYLKSIIFFLAILSAVLFQGCRKEADVVVQESDPEAYLPADNLRVLTGRAGIIFKGVVSEIRYETDRETNLPYTYVTFRQIETVKDLTGKFGKDTKEKITVRNFGGLREDGRVFAMSHLPEIMLGAVYVVFYSAGDWDTTPVVGGENGVFQVLKSSTLGHEMLIDHSGSVLVGLSGDSIKTIPLSPQSGAILSSDEKRVSIKQNKQSSDFKVKENSIYSEDNVKKLMEEESDTTVKDPDNESAGKTDRDSLRIKELTTLPLKPISLEDFWKAVRESDTKYRKDFTRYYSNVNFEGRRVKKDKEPITPKRK